MDTQLLTLLRSVDTPTVCNAIEVAQGRRGFNAFTRGTMLASDPKGVMAGYAVTAQIAALAPPTEDTTIIRARRMAYYKAMAEGGKPSVAVVEDLDFPHCIGAYWGEINTTIHKGFGMAGALTKALVDQWGDARPRRFGPGFSGGRGQHRAQPRLCPCAFGQPTGTHHGPGCAPR